MTNISLQGIHHLFDVPRKHQFSHRQRKTLDFLGSDMGRERERVGICYHIDKGWAGMLKCLLECRPQVGGVLNSYTQIPIASASFAKFGFFRSVCQSGNPATSMRRAIPKLIQTRFVMAKSYAINKHNAASHEQAQDSSNQPNERCRV